MKEPQRHTKLLAYLDRLTDEQERAKADIVAKGELVKIRSSRK